MPGVLLVGIDVESANECSLGYATYGRELFETLEIPVTWYVTGRTLESYPEAFADVSRSSLIDLQAHTYDHTLLKCVLTKVPEKMCGHAGLEWQFTPGGTFEQVSQDLDRCQNAFRSILGEPAVALTGPWAYYRGLGDRPDLLELVRAKGFRILRTFGRDEFDGQPVPMDWQPFFYDIQGYPDVLEIMIHDYQDDFCWEAFNLNVEESYADHLRKVAKEVAQRDLVWSLCSHDHGCSDREGFERKGRWLRPTLQAAKDLGIQFLTSRQYYERKRVS